MMQLSADQAREALVSHVASLGSVPQNLLRDSVKIKKIQPMSGYNYTLDTFMERRTLAFVQEAHHPERETPEEEEECKDGGAGVEEEDDATMPDMWDVPVKCDAIFVDAEKKVTMPHTSMTLPCTQCYTSGKTRCSDCTGNGTRRCTACFESNPAPRLGRGTPVAAPRDPGIASRLRSRSVKPNLESTSNDDGSNASRRKSASHGVTPASYPDSSSPAKSPQATARSRASHGVTPAKFHALSTPEPPSRSSRFRRRFSRNKTRKRSSSVKAPSSRRQVPVSPLGRTRQTSVDDSEIDAKKSTPRRSQVPSFSGNSYLSTPTKNGSSTPSSSSSSSPFATKLFSKRSPKAIGPPPSSFNHPGTESSYSDSYGPPSSDGGPSSKSAASSPRSSLGRPSLVVNGSTDVTSDVDLSKQPLDARARRDCPKCEGRGITKCDRCNGQNDITCDTCEGSGFVKRFMQLAVTWSTQTAEVPITPSKLVQAMPSTLPRNPHKRRPKPKVSGGSKANDSSASAKLENGEVLSPALKAELIENFIRGDRGDVVFHKEGTTVPPLTRKDFPSEKLVTTSIRLLAEEHRSTAAKILRQRHYVEYVPVFRVKYSFKGKDMEFWVYGSQRRVFTEDFHDQSERCVIL